MVDRKPGGWTLGPAYVRPWKRGPWLRATHPAVRLLTRARWIWTVHIRHRAKYKDTFTATGPRGWSLNVPAARRVLYLPPWLARLTDRLRGR